MSLFQAWVCAGPFGSSKGTGPSGLGPSPSQLSLESSLGLQVAGGEFGRYLISLLSLGKGVVNSSDAGDDQGGIAQPIGVPSPGLHG